MKNFSRGGATAQRKTQRKPSAVSVAPLRRCVRNVSVIAVVLICFGPALAQTTRAHASLSAEAKALLEQAIGVVCTQARLDPKSSVAIDDMQARPSLPVHTPEARAGAERAQKLLPIAKELVISSLRQLSTEFNFQKSPRFRSRLRYAIARVNSVKRVRPDMESRDNASVYLSRPHVITFGTIFLAGLRSDEGMISVLAHELMHIADGDNDSLRALVVAIGNKASDLTGLDVHGQRGEEVTCDLVGAMAARAHIFNTPDYESIARRLARSIQHNCVELDEGDEDHLSPRNTIRALLALNPGLVRELVNDRF
ncbi:MAG TPA: hypothetical protein VKB02_14120 [Pyrinomonadaceae bacterium]|nr:hypothetical protein [Pyrinomonadaceae bacterium]